MALYKILWVNDSSLTYLGDTYCSIVPISYLSIIFLWILWHASTLQPTFKYLIIIVNLYKYTYNMIVIYRSNLQRNAVYNIMVKKQDFRQLTLNSWVGSSVRIYNMDNFITDPYIITQKVIWITCSSPGHKYMDFWEHL